MNKQRVSNKYMRLVDHLAAQIRSGRLSIGDRLPTFVELQQAFNVTSPTVNRAMIALEQQGLVERRRGSGIYVAFQSDSVAVHNPVIGLAGWSFQYGGQSLYWMTLLAGVREEAARCGAQILLLDYDSSAGWEKADGLLVCDWTKSRTLSHVPPTLPCVSMMVAAEGISSVVTDDYQGVWDAMQHLLSLGHSRIAYLHGPRHTVTQRRLAAYCDALEAAGIKPQSQWQRLLLWEHNYDEDYFRAGHLMMTQWLQTDWKQAGCTALLCQNDEAGLGAAQALREAGLHLPHDVSLVGFDGLKLGDYISPRLTTVSLPLREIGVLAVQTLNRQIRDDAVTIEHHIIQPRLQVRESTTAPSPTSPL